MWMLIHDAVAHPICALLWLVGLQRAGDWLHDVTVHPLNYADEEWAAPKPSESLRTDWHPIGRVIWPRP